MGYPTKGSSRRATSSTSVRPLLSALGASTTPHAHAVSISIFGHSRRDTVQGWYARSHPHLPSMAHRGTAYLGFHGDVNATYPVGRIDEESKKLIRTTRQCLDEAIKLCKPGTLVRDLGKVMCVSPPSLPREQSLTAPPRPRCSFAGVVSPSHARMAARSLGRTRDTASMTYSTARRMYLITRRTKPSEL